MNKIPTLVFSFLLIFLLPGQGVTAPEVATYDGLLHAIRAARAASQQRIEQVAEQEKVREAWETGKLVNEHILLNKKRAKYGERVFQRLSFDLGTSKRELHYRVEFARTYPIVPAPAQLSWAHYRELLAIKDEKQRVTTEQEAAEKHWSQKELRQEIKRRRLATTEELSGELPAITPGPLNTYQIIRLKDRLKIDLGFGIYLDLPKEDSKKFKEGDIVRIDPSSHGLTVVIAIRGTGGAGAKPPEAAEAISDLFTYTATVTQVVDGDTFHALIDLGFGITLAQRVRLRRIDAPEILTANGKEAKAYLEKILHRDQGRILMKSIDIDQHGRPIADVWVKNKPVDQEMLDQGLAARINE